MIQEKKTTNKLLTNLISICVKKWWDNSNI